MTTSSTGMEHLTSSPEWRDLFDCVIVLARKPEFYRSHRPFRRVSEPTWDSVDAFEPGVVYQGGNLRDFSKLTGWYVFFFFLFVGKWSLKSKDICTCPIGLGKFH